MQLNHEILRNFRNELNYSQEYMAHLLDMEQPNYNRLENGKTKLKMEHIPKIAKAMGKATEEVLSNLTGWAVTSNNYDNAQNNQNVVIQTTEKELWTKLLAEKDERILLLEEQLKVLHQVIASITNVKDS